VPPVAKGDGAEGIEFEEDSPKTMEEGLDKGLSFLRKRGGH